MGIIGSDDRARHFIPVYEGLDPGCY